ncbi:MAG: hypothetical protein PHT59_00245 [Candidatus Omnitrophica bacterium]|nr:hypothetical protein [Candidatus Omnitrophota bacterium]
MKKIFGAMVLVMLLAGAGSARGQEQRGRLLAEGSYFSVYAEPGVDVYRLLTKIDYEYLVQPRAFGAEKQENLNDILARTLDGLYQEVSDILDIHIYSFKGKIVFVTDQPSLGQLLKEQYNLDFDERSIYYYDQNVIYVSASDMTPGMLGHEIAHAIISHYFVVPPPTKLQEVLAGYVEYTLRKNHRP